MSSVPLKTMKIIKEFSWDIKKSTQHYYRVQCMCQDSTSPQQQSSHSSLSSLSSDEGSCGIPGHCPTTTIVTIAASSINDLCSKLSKSGISCNQIQRVDKHVEPITQKQSGCTEPVQLPPANDCQSCCDFLGIEQAESSSLSSLSSSRASSFASSNPGPLPPFETVQEVKEPHPNHFTNVIFGAVVFSEQILTPQPIPIKVLPLSQITETIQVDCCPVPLPLSFEFMHNLNVIQPLARFLQTNGFSLIGTIQRGVQDGTFIELNFRKNPSFWQGGAHYTGQSPSGNYQESWDILCQFGCSDKNSWRFSLIVTSTNVVKRASARLLAYFDKTVVCPKSDVFFGFNFSLNLSSMQTNPATTQPIILNDEFGFFTGTSLMRFQLIPQNAGSGSNQELVDLSVPYDATLFVPAGV